MITSIYTRDDHMYLEQWYDHRPMYVRCSQAYVCAMLTCLCMWDAHNMWDESKGYVCWMITGLCMWDNHMPMYVVWSQAYVCVMTTSLCICASLRLLLVTMSTRLLDVQMTTRCPHNSSMSKWLLDVHTTLHGPDWTGSVGTTNFIRKIEDLRSKRRSTRGSSRATSGT